MKVLFLMRQSRGGAAVFARELQSALADRDVSIDILDATDAIPNSTEPNADKQATDWLKRAGASYDLVHAWGYRSAWACGSAYGDREAWLYSAYDMPKTTHRLLIDRLNLGQAGLCSSRGVFRALDEALAMELEIVTPGATPLKPSEPREALRERFGIEPDQIAIGALGPFEPEAGMGALIEAIANLGQANPRVVCRIAGEGSMRDELEQLAQTDARPNGTQLFGWQERPVDFLEALDLLVVPSRRAGFSLTAVQAMGLGLPVALRESSGLLGIVDRDVSGFYFKDDDELLELLKELIGIPLTLESVGRAAKIRALDQFGIDRVADRTLDIYEGILGV